LASNRIREIVEVGHGGSLQLNQGGGRAHYEIKLPLAALPSHSGRARA
jgi:hypothetical protein